MTKAEYNRKWQLANPEKFRAYRRTYRLANPDKVVEQKRRWRLNNPDKVSKQGRQARLKNLDQYLETERRWAAANRDRMNAATQKWRSSDPERTKLLWRKQRNLRRARQRSAIVGDLKAIQKIYARCAELNQLFKGLVVDHVIPLAKGGTHEAKNLQIIYDFENRRKNARLDYKPKVVFL